MTDHDLKTLFSQEGLRLTNQRKRVFEVMSEAKLPLNAEEIFLKLLEQDDVISLSTVYRILELFVEKEIVLKSHLSENKASYVIKHGHKHYLTCLNCKKVIEIEGCPVPKIEATIQTNTNFLVTSHKLEFYGLCPECQ